MHEDTSPFRAETLNITTKKICEWLRSKQSVFIAALIDLAESADIGFEEDAKRDSYGEFTGKFMCGIASGVIEVALREKFGNLVDVYGIRIRTTYMDDPNLIKNFHMSHQIVRFRLKNSDEEWTVDATYKQFQPLVNAFRIMIFPTKNEKNMYTQDQALEQATQSYGSDHKMIGEYTPAIQQPGALYKNYLEYAKTGALGPNAVEKIEKLKLLLLSEVTT